MDTTDLANALNAIKREIQTLRRREIRDWLKLGELLTNASEMLAGGYTSWLRSEGIPKTTAYKAKAAWRNFQSVPTSGHFSKEAMAILENGGLALAEAIELSTHRQKITARIARQLLQKHSQKPTPKRKRSEGRVFVTPNGTVTVKTTILDPTLRDYAQMLTSVLRDLQLQAQQKAA